MEEDQHTDGEKSDYSNATRHGRKPGRPSRRVEEDQYRDGEDSDSSNMPRERSSRRRTSTDNLGNEDYQAAYEEQCQDEEENIEPIDLSVTTICYNCRVEGHNPYVCPQPCGKCLESGHRADQCLVACKCDEYPGHRMEFCKIMCPRTLCRDDTEHRAVGCKYCCVCESTSHYATSCLHTTCVCLDRTQQFGIDCRYRESPCKVDGCKKPYCCALHCGECGGAHGGKCFAKYLGDTERYKCWVRNCHGTFEWGKPCPECTSRQRYFDRGPWRKI